MQRNNRNWRQPRYLGRNILRAEVDFNSDAGGPEKVNVGLKKSGDGGLACGRVSSVSDRGKIALRANILIHNKLAPRRRKEETLRFRLSLAKVASGEGGSRCCQ